MSLAGLKVVLQLLQQSSLLSPSRQSLFLVVFGARISTLASIYKIAFALVSRLRISTQLFVVISSSYKAQLSLTVKSRLASIASYSLVFTG